MSLIDILLCPLCSAPLSRADSRFICRNGHSYDIASSGYVNLLPPGKGSNAHTGDGRGMLRARRDFLSLGYYDGISDRLGEMIDANATGDKLRILDAGSGEGYHITRIARARGDRLDCAIGADASKHGADIGAKAIARDPISGKILFTAANIFSLPIADASLDVMISMFAPIPYGEAMRTLVPGGILAVVSSGARHLYRLRELLYDEPREGDVLDVSSDGFSVTAKEELEYSFTLKSPDELITLYNMTPFSYRTSQESAERLTSETVTEMGADVIITVLRKA